ncbi:MAG: MBL fold metallo-hydrolase [bacterium]|nr:MBL fold metallo-hydrolase [bacterium]
MTLSFFGAAGGVTGSCVLLETPREKIMIDCGFFQGDKQLEEKNDDPFPFNPPELSAVILTHAHLDHCGRIPRLCAEKLRCPIYTTAPTLDLAEFILLDAAEISVHRSKRSGRPSLYTPADVHGSMRHFTPIAYHEEVRVGPDVSFHLIDAGHILGSASIVVRAEGKTIVFSGDLGNTPAPIIRPTEYPDHADIAIIETTYGDRLHHGREDRRETLKAAFQKTINEKGVLLIPAFAMERTQELLHEIDHFIEHQEIPAIPVFLDSPLAIELTHVFEKHVAFYGEKERQHFSYDNFYKFPSFEMTATQEDGRMIEQTPPPKVIIAGSGMLQGGRILGHAARYLPSSTTTLLIVGYQAEGTLGRRLLDGEKRVRINGREIDIRAHIEEIDAYSAHADQKQLLTWLQHIHPTPLKIFLTHGEPTPSRVFAEKVKLSFGIDATIPREGLSYILAS